MNTELAKYLFKRNRELKERLESHPEDSFSRGQLDEVITLLVMLDLMEHKQTR